MTIEHKKIKLIFNEKMQIMTYMKDNENWISLNENVFIPSFYLITNKGIIDKFILDSQSNYSEEIETKFGKGKKTFVMGIDNTSLETSVHLSLCLEMYENYPETIIISAKYSFLQQTSFDCKIEKVILNQFLLNSQKLSPEVNSYDFWVMSGSASIREPWLKQVTSDFYKDNFQGIHGPGYGGGIPFIYIWQKEMGIALSHIEPIYRIVDFPIETQTNGLVKIAISYEPRENEKVLCYEQIFETIKSMITVNKGDYYKPAKIYKEFLEKQEIKFSNKNKKAYETIWETWGFHRDFTMDQIRTIIPYLKDFGIEWITLDDRWFNCVGDWKVRTDNFPEGEKTIKEFVKELHNEGFLVKLWTIPGEVDGMLDLTKWKELHPHMKNEISKHPYHEKAEIFLKHPDWLIKDKNGSFSITKRANYFLCPCIPEVIEFYKKITEKMIGEWDFDGLKQDAVYICPPCYNVEHNHAYPEEAPENFHKILKVIYDTAISIKKDAVVESCPCGTPPTFTWLPYQNQIVVPDARDSWDLRFTHKFLKAISEPDIAILSDHIELTDESNDFASHLGIGGVTSTRFTPQGRDFAQRIEKTGKLSDLDLPMTSERKSIWIKWFNLIYQKSLFDGQYLSKYDIIYDKPECHLIKKNDKLYYAFFAEKWDQEIEFKGLEQEKYVVFDYVNNKNLGEITQKNPKLKVIFEKYLLVEISPLDTNL
ncbi:MAG: alpha-galactosidase [bacterium]